MGEPAEPTRAGEITLTQNDLPNLPDPIVPLRLLTGAGLGALNVTNICYG